MPTTVTTLVATWGRIRAVDSGHFAVYYPGASDPANTLVLYDPAGHELVRNTDALRDYDLAIDAATGEIVATYLAFIDGSASHPVRRWATGIRVAPPPAPAPAPAGNAAIVNQIRALLDRIA